MTDSEIPLGVVRLPHGEGLNLPAYETPGSAGMDIRAAVDGALTIAPRARALVPTGLILEIPEGYEVQIRPRSGLAYKHGITCLNTPGTIDSDYRGEVQVLLVNLSDTAFSIGRGERIAQMVIAPVVRAELVRAAGELSATARGGGGFTSGLAKAALANPDGPLGVIGHVDLAWTHCFDEVLGSGKDVKRINRASQFVGPIATLMQQQRVGAALLRLRIALREVTVAINSTYDAAKERGGASGYAIADAEALGNLWMLRQDLNQFVLLGDPAASFFLSPPPKPTVTELLSSTFGFGVASQQAEPEPEPAGERLARQMESGLRELFFRDVSIERLAREFHVSVEELRRWERAYRSAGRDALANIVIKRDGE